MTDYLPKDATIEQACNWLQAKTGQTWLLPRLIESGLRPYVWLGNDPAHPYLFENRPAGYQVQVMFQDDLTRLEADGTCTLTMFYKPDGQLVKVEPSGVIPLSELKFKREDIHELAVQTAPAQNTATPAPVGTTERRTWFDVSGSYIVGVMRAGQYSTAKELYNALESKAGIDSPFDKGTGNNRFSLFIRELATPLARKTVQNNWQKLLKAAAQK